MRSTNIICDACGSEILRNDTEKIKIPIRVIGKEGVFLELRDMDLCDACINRISECYYGICLEHDRSGFVGIAEDY